MKAVIYVIAHPLSFLTGCVPSNLKIAKITPVFTSGRPQDVHNYRLISVLPCFSKIHERLVYNRLSKFLSQFNILFDHQFGFRSNYSTGMALIHYPKLLARQALYGWCVH